MSHPSINRWGTNLFWYNFWYTDKKLALSIHNDMLLNNLIFTYLNYGLFYKKNIFLNNYWHKLENTDLKELNTHQLKYFQIMEHKNKITDEITKFTTRIKKKHIYFSKLWILKYQNWILINLYSFQPITKPKKLSMRKKNKFLGIEQKVNLLKKLKTLIRFKLFLNLFTKFYLHDQNTFFCF